jgi:cation diffusion facilitator family transporter
MAMATPWDVIVPWGFLLGELDVSQKIAVARLSVISNTALVVAKLVIGVLIGSVSVISEAIHSGVDLLASLIAFFAVKAADEPADEKHSFGHGKFENLSGTVEALLIFVAAAWILYEAIHKLIKPKPLEEVGWGVAVMLASSVVNFIVSNMLFKVGNETDSIALKADAWHLRTDVYTSAGVMMGLGLIWLGKFIVPDINLGWLDPIAAIVVALMIIHAAYVLSKQAIADLLDTSLPADEEEWIKNKIRSMHPVVYSFHNLKTRKSGPRRFIEFHIKVDPLMSVRNSHSLNDRLVAEIKARYPSSHVMVHIEPCENPCEPKCTENCFKHPMSKAESK